MEVHTVGIVGAGAVGRGIAMTCAVSGLQVRLYDVDSNVVETAMFQIGQRVASQARHARLMQDEMEGVLHRIRTLSRLDGMDEADIVIEAVPEDLETKRMVFSQLDRICPERTVFVTGTSGLSITELAQATLRPDRFIGMHFFHPVSTVGLVEIARGYETSYETFEVAVALCRRIDKTPIVVQDVPPFVVNRILVPMVNEAIFMLQEGLATAEDIDTAMRLGANHPIGPLALADKMGLDALLTITETLLRETGDPKYRPPRLLRQLVRSGKLGRKTGEGFYHYDED
ncbi:putative 3-hydroxybutyryl-CoA dehydrogenase [Alicyclobacillus hesperidum]|uniref:3-hydroxyacyl-CoA dehydrogenase n=1 Tax=Alicyclobacillus hesperidum TaxID=89784 RepID=A0A1H2Q061_9BACL|nr:3-hydroxyacyl-CoA dehydrogenase NAD-binding domain-containing protein [Alicyclobacillus hesperidum]GLV12883.1 putative 3-hydroxybutyryl-CoA dehydrogenase [Alicyclobacillus hesperidum]SDW00487.1 3-hydroxyacyl-CoA dehydrogenase [Alicyclobacillus hesperidum]